MKCSLHLSTLKFQPRRHQKLTSTNNIASDSNSVFFLLTLQKSFGWHKTEVPRVSTECETTASACFSLNSTDIHFPVYFRYDVNSAGNWFRVKNTLCFHAITFADVDILVWPIHTCTFRGLLKFSGARLAVVSDTKQCEGLAFLLLLLLFVCVSVCVCVYVCVFVCTRQKT